ncbi:unnamed protein product [Cuscuta epithymum]|uniref:Uncharacterized protein n=1 Tax=Cuscuta epithymum TaxID=186058 RepID=A0AAV0DH49_9ASTE|nr:unnamed protein product [Cuscuta epithymum]
MMIYSCMIEGGYTMDGICGVKRTRENLDLSSSEPKTHKLQKVYALRDFPENPGLLVKEDEFSDSEQYSDGHEHSAAEEGLWGGNCDDASSRVPEGSYDNHEKEGLWDEFHDDDDDCFIAQVGSNDNHYEYSHVKENGSWVECDDDVDCSIAKVGSYEYSALIEKGLWEKCDDDDDDELYCIGQEEEVGEDIEALLCKSINNGRVRARRDYPKGVFPANPCLVKEEEELRDFEQYSDGHEDFAVGLWEESDDDEQYCTGQEEEEELGEDLEDSICSSFNNGKARARRDYPKGVFPQNPGGLVKEDDFSDSEPYSDVSSRAPERSYDNHEKGHWDDFDDDDDCFIAEVGSYDNQYEYFPVIERGSWHELDDDDGECSIAKEGAYEYSALREKGLWEECDDDDELYCTGQEEEVEEDLDAPICSSFNNGRARARRDYPTGVFPENPGLDKEDEFRDSEQYCDGHEDSALGLTEESDDDEPYCNGQEEEEVGEDLEAPICSSFNNGKVLARRDYPKGVSPSNYNVAKEPKPKHYLGEQIS